MSQNFVSYVPLHLHTDKSLMDGTATPWEYAERAAAVGMTAVAATDHGTMSARREFDAAMRKHNIKPIFGIEAYVTHDINDRRSRASRTEPLDRLYNHLTILAKNVKGYKNLFCSVINNLDRTCIRFSSHLILKIIKENIWGKEYNPVPNFISYILYKGS